MLATVTTVVNTIMSPFQHCCWYEWFAEIQIHHAAGGEPYCERISGTATWQLNSESLNVVCVLCHSVWACVIEKFKKTGLNPS